MYQQERISYWSQLAILLGLTGGALIIGGFVILAVLKIMTGVPLTQLTDVLNNPKYVDAARMAQGLGAVLTFGLPAFIYGIIVNNRKPFAYLGFNTSASGKQAFYVVVIMFTSLFVGAALSELNQLIPISKSLADKFKKMEEEYNKQVINIATMKNIGDYIYTLIIIALIPALVEELLFRSSLQQIMIGITKNAFVGILITSIIFSAVHMSFYGFLPRLFLGMLLGYIFYYSKNAWLNMFSHFFNNAIVVTQLYTLSKNNKLDTKAMDDHFPWYICIMSAAVLFLLMQRFKQESEVVVAQKNIPKDTE